MCPTGTVITKDNVIHAKSLLINNHFLTKDNPGTHVSFLVNTLSSNVLSLIIYINVNRCFDF